MVPSSLPEAPSLDADEKRLLLEIAHASIQRAVTGHGGSVTEADLELDLESLPAVLREERATFVTLEQDGMLRGCIGSIEACRPLAVDVAQNTARAALTDTRFAPVQTTELADLTVKISVLSALAEMDVGSEQELIDALRPDIDGLVITDESRRATFLPSVWEKIPEPVVFVRQLQRKAGLSEGHWSPTMMAARYTTEEFS